MHWPVVGGEAFRGGLRKAARTVVSEAPPTGAGSRPKLSTPPRERDRAEGLARAYRDQGDTMRWIADEAGLHYSFVNRIRSEIGT